MSHRWWYCVCNGSLIQHSNISFPGTFHYTSKTVCTVHLKNRFECIDWHQQNSGNSHYQCSDHRRQAWTPNCSNIKSFQHGLCGIVCRSTDKTGQWSLNKSKSQTPIKSGYTSFLTSDKEKNSILWDNSEGIHSVLNALSTLTLYRISTAFVKAVPYLIW